jgi:hypothetical protein
LFTNSRYEAEIAKYEKTIQNLMDENKASESNKNKKEIKKCNVFIDDLKKEMNVQMQHTENVIKFIEEKRNTLLENIQPFNIREITKNFIQVKFN